MIRNAERLCSRLDAMEGELREAAGAALEHLAQSARREAMARAPVETGRLRASIHAEQNGLTARVASDCPYAASVELGTSKCPARPFLAPSALAGREGLARAAREKVARR